VASLLQRWRPSGQPTTVVDDDARLVALAHADQEAFAALYHRHVAGIYGYCYRLLGSPERAEDATQQVFAQALASLPRYREQERFRAWLYTIAHHVIHTQLGAERPHASLDMVAAVPDPGHTPEEQALGALDRAALLAAIARLPGDQRRVIELRIAGMKGREIAAELGRSHEAVRMLQHRALNKLASALMSSDQPRGGPHGA
jgi:RNA polymerase sigma-70 factor (ECF subfamily)